MTETPDQAKAPDITTDADEYADVHNDLLAASTVQFALREPGTSERGTLPSECVEVFVHDEAIDALALPQAEALRQRLTQVIDDASRHASHADLQLVADLRKGATRVLGIDAEGSSVAFRSAEEVGLPPDGNPALLTFSGGGIHFVLDGGDEAVLALLDEARLAVRHQRGESSDVPDPDALRQAVAAAREAAEDGSSEGDDEIEALANALDLALAMLRDFGVEAEPQMTPREAYNVLTFLTNTLLAPDASEKEDVDRAEREARKAMDVLADFLGQHEGKAPTPQATAPQATAPQVTNHVVPLGYVIQDGFTGQQFFHGPDAHGQVINTWVGGPSGAAGGMQDDAPGSVSVLTQPGVMLKTLREAQDLLGTARYTGGRRVRIVPVWEHAVGKRPGLDFCAGLYGCDQCQKASRPKATPAPPRPPRQDAFEGEDEFEGATSTYRYPTVNVLDATLATLFRQGEVAVTAADGSTVVLHFDRQS